MVLVLEKVGVCFCGELEWLVSSFMGVEEDVGLNELLSFSYEELCRH